MKYSLLIFLSLFLNNELYIIDGDTIKLDNVKIRLLAIDAPEGKQFFGDSAKIHLEHLLKGKEITYKIDSYDQYHRALAVIYVDNTININLKMVSDGYAWSYRYNKNQIYINAMNEAKKNKRGLWKYPNQIDPYDFRKANK
ncbi:MAG: hypothetical protein RL154_1159 [Pseudomonadota bacterium]|jgi:endonuclease YncB( thermonuclease family)